MTHEHCRDRGRQGDPQRLPVRVLEPRRGQGLLLQVGRGLSHEVVEAISEHKNEPAWMREVPPQVARVLLRAAAADVGRQPRRDRLRGHLLLPHARPRSRSTRGTTCRPTSRTRSTSSASPRRRRSTSPASAPSTSPRSSTTRCRRTSRSKGVIFPDTDTALREHADLVAVLRHDHPAERQQVRGAQLGRLVGRLVHLRAAGRADRDAAAGLLPHQRGEHGPVRADADHRRRGRLRALRRGLHRADLHDRHAALGGRRDHRQAGRPLPLHDDPELVEQHLQPRHQARRRLRGRDDGVGRRQPRLEADDEVPGHLPDGRAAPTARSSRSPSPGRASTRTPAARSSTSPRTRRRRSSPSRSPRTAAAPATAACSRSRRAPAARSRRSSATR